MSLQIVGLFLVMLIFGAVLGWVYAPGNRKRMQAASRLPFDDDAAEVLKQNEAHTLNEAPR